MNELPEEARNAIPGFLGSVTSLTFLKGPLWLKAAMVFGGSTVSFYAAEPLVEWFNVPKAQGLIGFAIGLFGMAVIAKVHELIDAFRSADLAQLLFDRLRKLLGGP